MLYLRTAAGGFINAESIVGLSPQRGNSGITGWLAICPDGTEIALAAFYSVPGRIEKALPHLFPAPLPQQAPVPAFRRRFVVPYTNKVVHTDKPRRAPHGVDNGIIPARLPTGCGCGSRGAGDHRRGLA